MRRFIIRSVVFAVILVFVLELTVRVFAPQQLIRFDFYYLPDDGLGRVPAPNIDTILNTGERPVHFITDSQGFRVGEVQRGTSEHRILALGDSFLVAMQVEYEQTMTALLEEKLSAQTGETVSVVNAGSANFGVNHYRIAAERLLSQGEFNAVIVFMYMGNDLTTTFVDRFAAQTQVEERTQLRVPRNLSRSELLNAVFYPVNNWLETNSQLFVLAKDRASVFMARLGLTARYFPPDLLIKNEDSQTWSVTAQIMGQIRDEAHKKDVPVIFVLLPSVYQVDPSYLEWALTAFGVLPEEIDIDQPSQMLFKACEPYNLHIVDVLPSFREAFSKGDILYGSVDTHLSSAGHELVADLLEPALVSILNLAERIQ